VSRFTIAACQVCATDDRAVNLATATRLVREAADRGADVVCLPEMWAFIGRGADEVTGGETLDGPSMTAMKTLAQELGIWLFPGSFAEISPEPGKVFNTSPCLDPNGAVTAVYRKIHLFDIEMAAGPSLRESDTMVPGDQAVVAETAFGRFGMSVCYDLRFPALYQALRDAGADVFLVPAAFTATTGKAHWEVLLRARAIEQQVWVVAADQVGRHNAARTSHGHSMVIDPWGFVVGRCSDGPGVTLAVVDPSLTKKVRGRLPCADHRRAFGPPDPVE
jgi:deaminated glutathione amidase